MEQLVVCLIGALSHFVKRCSCIVAFKKSAFNWLFRIIRETNERILNDFLAKKKQFERKMFEDYPNILRETIASLQNLNATVVQAYEDHEHTFGMMRYILR